MSFSRAIFDGGGAASMAVPLSGLLYTALARRRAESAGAPLH